VKVRMEEEAAASLEIEGGSNCGQFVAGHQFTLKRHFDADGQYALTHVQHDAHLEHREKSPKRGSSSLRESGLAFPKMRAAARPR